VALWVLALGVFLVTVVLVLWRPGNIHEATPALLGAFVMLLAGLIDRHDVLQVLVVVWNSAMTIISTFIMASVLEGAGFFDWVTGRLIQRARGSGHRLFHLVLAFSTCLTLFLNNDGSILLGTPVVIGLVSRLRLPRRAALAFLLGACLVASAASPPIGVSNMANLEAMSLVGITLLQHLRVVVVPAMVGLAAVWGLLYAVFWRSLPEQVDAAGKSPVSGGRPPLLFPHPHAPRLVAPPPGALPHERFRPPLPTRQPPPPPPSLLPPPAPPALPASPAPPAPPAPERLPFEPDFPFMWFAVGVVILVRAGFFAASLFGVPTYLVAMAGALVLLVANARRRLVDTRETLKKAPWPILAFAFGMDLLVFGLRNAGITVLLAHKIGPVIHGSALALGFLPGLLAAVISSLLNNHPGLITGALMLLDMGGLAGHTLHIAYSGVVLGSDLGALFTPIGTLASLMWFHILRQHGRQYSWWDYVKITLVVIPLSFLLTLCVLFGVSLLS
jgi:arsenical pump membrane protein